MHDDRALPIRGAEAVRTGIATAENHDALSVRGDLAGRIERVAEVALVLLRKEIHREMDPLQLASRDRQVTRLGRAHREHDRVVLRAHLVGVDVQCRRGSW